MSENKDTLEITLKIKVKEVDAVARISLGNDGEFEISCKELPSEIIPVSARFLETVYDIAQEKALEKRRSNK